jgi:beta-lactamase regulating signal transducer with metallopeptidase domain/phage tail protein X
MVELLNHLTHVWWAWTASMFWQVGLLILLIGSVDLLIRKWAWPQLRYALWSLILVKLLLPPSLSLPSGVVPELQPRIAQVLQWLDSEKQAAAERPTAISDFGLRMADSILSAGPQSGSLMVSTGGIVKIEDLGDGSPLYIQDHRQAALDDATQSVTPDSDPGPQLQWQFYAMLIWLSGTLILGIWLFLRLHSVAGRHAYRAAAASLPQSFYNHLADCSKRLGLRRIPRVAVTKRLTSPAVFGVVSPVLLMPKGYLSKLSRRDTEHMLLHELAHIKRGDLVMHSLYMLLQIVYWYHPLLWLVRRHLHHLRELSCDGTVAELLREQTPAYRQTLLETARRMLTTSVEPGLGLLGLFEDSNHLLVRLNWLTKPTWRYSTMKRAIVATIALLMFACVLPMAQGRETASNEEITRVSTEEVVPVRMEEVVPVRVEGDDQQTQDQLSREIAALQAQLERLMAQQKDLQNQLKALAKQRNQMQAERRESGTGRGGGAPGVRGRAPRERAEGEARVAPQEPAAGRGGGPPGLRRETPRGSSDEVTEVYIVKEGDTLASIARRFYGRENLSENIARIVKNNRLSEDGRELRVGQELQIPAPGVSERRGAEIVREEYDRRVQAQTQRAQDEVKRALKEADRARQEAMRAQAEARRAQAEGRDMEAWGRPWEQWAESEPMKNWERDMEKWGQKMEQWGQEFGRRQAAAVNGSEGESGSREMPPMPPMPAMPPMPPMPPASPGHALGAGAPGAPEVHMPVISPPAAPGVKDGREEANITRHVIEPLPLNRTLEIVNEVGSITLRAGEGETCRVAALVKARAPTAEEAQTIVQQVRTDITRSDDRLHIAMTKPQKRGDREGYTYTVDFEVTVPREARLKLSQAVGNIRLADLRGSVEASTKVGSIEATNVAGRVILSAEVGSIGFFAPKDFSAKVQAKSAMGSVQSDFPLEVVKPSGHAMGSSASGTIGTGEGELSLKTNVGSIGIRSQDAAPGRAERRRAEPRPRPEPHPQPRAEREL